MQDSTKRNIVWMSVRLVLPSLLGAFGALMATAVPAYYAAMCSAYTGV